MLNQVRHKILYNTWSKSPNIPEKVYGKNSLIQTPITSLLHQNQLFTGKIILNWCLIKEQVVECIWRNGLFRCVFLDVFFNFFFIKKCILCIRKIRNINYTGQPIMLFFKIILSLLNVQSYRRLYQIDVISGIEGSLD